jgi:membrane-bound serine protease (ClpP class)
MVRRENEFKIGDEVICPAGRLLTLTADEAAKPGRDGRSLLSAGTAPTLADVLAQLELTGHPQVAMQITAAEKVARLIAAAAPILMILGFLGIYIEIKTPGFGLPGILGAICLALFFWGHHIAGLAGMEDLVIFIAGCVLVLVEIFLIPGFGFTGVLGLALIFISLLGAMVRLAPGGPWLPAWPDVQIPLVKLLGSIVGAGAGALLLGRFLPRSPLFGKLTLGAATSAAEGYTAAPDTSALVGQTGVTLNLLRPAGTARFGDDRLDVTTSGEFIPAGTPVQIVEARGSRIVVQKIG